MQDGNVPPKEEQNKTTLQSENNTIQRNNMNGKKNLVSVIQMLIYLL